MKPRLLFVSPVVPAAGGNGRAMRAFAMLRALAEEYAVSLLVDDAMGRTAPADPEWREWCQAVRHLPRDAGLDRAARFRRQLRGRFPGLSSLLSLRPAEWAPASPGRGTLAAQAFPGTRFDACHVFRLYMAPHGLAGPTAAALTSLDLDDIESRTRRRLARLRLRRGHGVQAVGLLREAAWYAWQERRLLPRFRTVYVCSAEDRAALRRRLPDLNVAVAPNVVSPAGGLVDPAAGDEVLFVGNLGYYPNREGLDWFCRRVLPELRRQAVRPFTVRVVGGGLTARQARRLAATPGLQPTGWVAELTPWYHRARLAIVPVRAGGGTRIKMLEAMALGLPVVSTTAGAEGITAESGPGVWLADCPTRFARHCADLLADPRQAARLGQQGAAQARRLYSPSVLRACLFSDST